MAITPKYDVQRVPIDEVAAVTDRRAVNSDAVTSLAQSISEIGLQIPITVRVDLDILDPETGEAIGGYALIAGRHRLEACRQLGWEDIPAIVRECDALDAELWEIDENLMRAELSPSDRARCISRRKAIYEELHPETKPTHEGGEGRHRVTRGQLGHDTADRFTADTAAKTGQSERKVRRDAERGEKIAPDVLNAITDSKWDKGIVLDTLKKLNHDEQRQALSRVKSGASASFTDAYEFIKGDAAAPRTRNVKSPPEPMSDNEAMDQWLSTGLSWWNRGSQDWREEFLRRIDTPLFDRSNSGRAA